MTTMQPLERPSGTGLRPHPLVTPLGAPPRMLAEFTVRTTNLRIDVTTAVPLTASVIAEINEYTAEFDFNGTRHLIDVVTDVLQRSAVADFVVHADNTMRHRGENSLHVALRHPGDPDLAVGVVAINGQALSAVRDFSWSGHLAATWVVARDAATANALCVAAPQNLSRVSYVRLFRDGRAEISRDFPGALFQR